MSWVISGSSSSLISWIFLGENLGQLLGSNWCDEIEFSTFFFILFRFIAWNALKFEPDCNLNTLEIQTSWPELNIFDTPTSNLILIEFWQKKLLFVSNKNRKKYKAEKTKTSMNALKNCKEGLFLFNTFQKVCKSFVKDTLCLFELTVYHCLTRCKN